MSVKLRAHAVQNVFQDVPFSRSRGEHAEVWFRSGPATNPEDMLGCRVEQQHLNRSHSRSDSSD
jgi:hypothetical protein